MQKWVTELNTNEQRVNMRERSASGNSWVNILLGIWMIVSPFVLAFHSSKAIWNNVVAGAVVGILALIRWSMHQTGWELAKSDFRNVARYFAVRALSQRSCDVE